MLKNACPVFSHLLSFHLTAALKDKIWNEDYIDLSTILPPSFKYEKKDEKEDETDQTEAGAKTIL